MRKIRWKVCFSNERVTDTVKKSLEIKKNFA